MGRLCCVNSGGAGFATCAKTLGSLRTRCDRGNTHFGERHDAPNHGDPIRNCYHPLLYDLRDVFGEKEYPGRSGQKVLVFRFWTRTTISAGK